MAKIYAKLSTVRGHAVATVHRTDHKFSEDQRYWIVGVDYQGHPEDADYAMCDPLRSYASEDEAYEEMEDCQDNELGYDEFFIAEAVDCEAEKEPKVAEVKMQVTTHHITARNFTKHKGDVYAVIGRVPDTKTYAVRHVRAGDDAVEALTRSIGLNHYGFDVDPFICKLTAYGRVNDLFILTPIDSARPLVEVTISSHRVRHPRGKGWIYFNLPQGFDPQKPYDFYCIDNAMDLEGNGYALEFGDGEDNILDLTRPMRVYGVDMMWGGKRREKVCICRHPDLLGCDDDDDGFKPRIIQPLEPWLQIDNDGYEELYEYPY